MVLLNRKTDEDFWICGRKVSQMKEWAEKMETYFTQKITGCTAQFAQLTADNRADEADFQKIRANVYDIFRTILSVAIKTKGSDPAAVRSFFLEKTEQIPVNWSKAYALASANGDGMRACIEEIKLDTVKEIRAAFLCTWEGKS